MSQKYGTGNFPEEDKSGVFINSSAGYQVGSWPIFYREADTQADGPVIDTESDQYDSYQGLVMAGYQGWHGTPGDGCAHNPAEAWPHYANVAEQPFIFEPGVLRNNIDFWPDVSEYPITYEAPKDFVLPGGSTPRLYSSYDESTVDLHFSWMKEYGIDGVFMEVHSDPDNAMSDGPNQVRLDDLERILTNMQLVRGAYDRMS